MNRFYAVLEVAVIEHIDIELLATRHNAQGDVSVVGGYLVDELLMLCIYLRVDIGRKECLDARQNICKWLWIRLVACETVAQNNLWVKVEYAHHLSPAIVCQVVVGFAGIEFVIADIVAEIERCKIL